MILGIFLNFNIFWNQPFNHINKQLIEYIRFNIKQLCNIYKELIKNKIHLIKTQLKHLCIQNVSFAICN